MPPSIKTPSHSQPNALSHHAHAHQPLQQQQQTLQPNNHTVTVPVSSIDPTHSKQGGTGNGNGNGNGNKWNRNGYGQAIEPTIGKFSTEESSTVKRAVEEYCSTHGVTPSRLCSESDNRTDHLRGAWMDIAKQLPHRTVQSVYRHGLRLMHPFKRGAWDEVETNELLILVTKHGKKWSEIQNKLNRSADSCRDKYREFHTNFTKGKWKERESKELEMLVRKVLKVGNDVSLVDLGKFVELESVNVPWSTISQKMKNRSRLSCFKRFQQITGMKKTAGKKRKKSDSSNGVIVTSGAGVGAGAGGIRSQSHGHGRDATTVHSISNTALKTSHVPVPVELSAGAVTTLSTIATTNAIMPITVTENPINTPVSVPLPVQVPIPDPTAACAAEDALSSYDRQLIHSLATSSYERETDVVWYAIQYPLGDAKQRWTVLLDKWIEDFGMDEDEVFDRPVWEVAKDMLNQEAKEVEDEAEMAARTVEAVFLC